MTDGAADHGQGRDGFRVAIVGAGATGIGAAIRLEEAGIRDVTLFEKADELGGTWRDNTYPGVACDIPSHLYRYSFAPNAEWTTEYAGGAEILAYLRATAEAYGVRERIRFGRAVRRAAFADGRWTLEAQDGPEGEFDAVIFASGVLHVPRLPDITGRASFGGTAFHSSRWDHGIGLAGQRVGIIGTGSTATQILPAIVDEVASVTLFQRTPQWIVAVPNRPFAEAKKERFRADPAAMDGLYAHLNTLFNERFAASLVGQNPEGLAEIARACRDNLDTVRDPELRRRLTPSYEPGCKRLVVSDKFYGAIQKPNARLVDAAIRRIEPRGVRTQDDELHELDVIVYATGFDPFAFFRPAEIVGPGSVSLNDRWERSAEAHRTAMVPGFPNLFILGGPNSPIGNFSFLRTAELQIGHVVSLVRILAEGRAREIEPTEEATRAFNAALTSAMAKTIWVTGGCDSWYFDREGKVASWPWSYGKFESDLGTLDLREYRLS